MDSTTVGATLAEALPLAVAIAVSPLTIIPAILLLLTPRALATGSAFLVGWLAGLAVTATVFTLLASVVEQTEETPAWASWARLVLGAVLIVWGIRQWLGRHTPKPPPAWMGRISTLTPARALRFAFVLAIVNPKVLLLSAAAGLGIGAADITAVQTVLCVAVFAVVAALSVAGPVLLYALLGERMLAPLTRAQQWLERNNAAVMSVVFVVIGVALVAKGYNGLR